MALRGDHGKYAATLPSAKIIGMAFAQVDSTIGTKWLAGFIIR
jgi:hypothetical protein